MVGARETASEIHEPGLKSQSFKEIAKKQAKRGDMKGALAWIRAQSSAQIKVYGLLGVAEAILRR